MSLTSLLCNHVTDARLSLRQADLLDISSATDIHGTDFDDPSNPIAKKGKLDKSITPGTYVDFVDFIDDTQLARFGVHNGQSSLAFYLGAISYAPQANRPTRPSSTRSGSPLRWHPAWTRPSRTTSSSSPRYVVFPDFSLSQITDSCLLSGRQRLHQHPGHRTGRAIQRGVGQRQPVHGVPRNAPRRIGRQCPTILAVT